MKHRSPLVTLAVVVVWFVVMLVVNLVVHPGHGSAAAEPYDKVTQPASPSPSAAASASPSTEPTSASPSQTQPTRKNDDYPDKVVYVGRTGDGTLGVAIAVLNGNAAAYVCDGRQVEAWLRGSTDSDKVSLRARTGARIDAQLHGKHLRGKVVLARHTYSFSITEAAKPAGLYRARGSKTTIGWIVLPSGSQVGVATRSGKSAAAPKLDPSSAQVSANGETLTVEPVTGDTQI